MSIVQSMKKEYLSAQMWVHPKCRVPRFGTSGFSCSRGLPLLEIWDKIPTDTDILLTHSPPLGWQSVILFMCTIS